MGEVQAGQRFSFCKLVDNTGPAKRYEVEPIVYLATNDAKMARMKGYCVVPTDKDRWAGKADKPVVLVNSMFHGASSNKWGMSSN